MPRTYAVPAMAGVGPAADCAVAAAATIWPALDLPEPRADDAEVPAAIEAIHASLATAGAPIRSTRRPAGGSGRLRAMSIALQAPLVGAPLVRRRPGFVRRTGMHRSMAILGALVALRGRPRRSIFKPPQIP